MLRTMKEFDIVAYSNESDHDKGVNALRDGLFQPLSSLEGLALINNVNWFSSFEGEKVQFAKPGRAIQYEIKATWHFITSEETYNMIISYFDSMEEDGSTVYLIDVY